MAKELQAGDELRSHDGRWLAVEGARDTGREEAVYNCRVAEYHTYFVGDAAWGWSVWAHNSCAPKGNRFVDLTDAKARNHILEGDATGGGHRPGLGKPGKSEFPKGWSDEKILHEISDVATDPASKVTPGRGGRFVIEGTRDGVDIRVIVEPPSKGGRIVTGFPTNTPRNP